MFPLSVSAIILCACAIGYPSFSAAESCANVHLDLSASERMEKSELVLFGTEVTKREDCTASDTAYCPRRQIQFQVQCVLKNTKDYTVDEIITIGNRTTITRCDGTIFGYEDRGRQWIVMVTYDAGGDVYEWDEIVPGYSARQLWTSDLKISCGLTPKAPSGAQNNTCPWQDSTPQICPEYCDRKWKKYEEEKRCQYISIGDEVTLADATKICSDMGAGLVTLVTRETREMLQKSLPNNPDYKWWTAGTCEEGDCLWYNGYTNVDTSIEASGTGNVIFTKLYGEIVEANDASIKHLYICEKSTTSDPTEPGVIPVPVLTRPKCKSNETLAARIESKTINLGRVCCEIIGKLDPFVTDICEDDSNIPGRGTISPPIVYGPQSADPHAKYMLVLASGNASTGYYIHWFVDKVRLGGNGRMHTEEGSTLLSYLPPIPREEKLEVSLMVYRHTSSDVNITRSVLNFSQAENCDGIHDGRCGFNFTRLRTEYQGLLSSVGTRNYWVNTDEYSVKELYSVLEESSVRACRLFWPDLQEYNGKFVCPVPDLRRNSATLIGRSGHHVLLIYGIVLALTLLRM